MFLLGISLPAFTPSWWSLLWLQECLCVLNQSLTTAGGSEGDTTPWNTISRFWNYPKIQFHFVPPSTSQRPQNVGNQSLGHMGMVSVAWGISFLASATILPSPMLFLVKLGFPSTRTMPRLIIFAQAYNLEHKTNTVVFNFKKVYMKINAKILIFKHFANLRVNLNPKSQLSLFCPKGRPPWAKTIRVLSPARSPFVTELVIWLDICSSPSAICLCFPFAGALAALGQMEASIQIVHLDVSIAQAEDC